MGLRSARSRERLGSAPGFIAYLHIVAAIIDEWLARGTKLHRRFPRALAVAGLVLLTFSVYHTSLSNGFVWDDHHLITMNPALTRENAISEAFLEDFWEAASQLRSDYYRPVIIVSYTVDHWFYGPDPWGYHLTNVLIHASTTVLLFILLTQLGLGVATAMAGAALFSCHPVLAESVAWISGRTDSTAAMLVLLCLVADTHSRRPQWAALTMAALIGALLAKEMAVIVPLLAVAAAFARGETLGHALRDRIYMLPVILGYFLVRFLVLGSPVAALVVHNQLPVASRLLFPLHLVGLLAALPRARRLRRGNPASRPVPERGHRARADPAPGLRRPP
jgi:hypothetical protein